MRVKKEALEKIIERMEICTDVFYPMAQRAECHPFLEFNGIMREYIELCRDSLEQNVDFIEDWPKSVKLYRLEYMAEKLNCIFGKIFSVATPEQRARFVQVLMGQD